MGHNVRVLGPSGWWKYRNLQFEYPIHRWPTLRGLFEEQVTFAQLKMDVALWGCDIIHAHSTFPSGYAVTKLKKRKRIPLVITPQKTAGFTPRKSNIFPSALRPLEK